jgi:hypothetical protein
MTDIKITKLFKDPNTGTDIYILSIQMGTEYYNIPVTKTQFEELFYRMRAIFDNTEIN